MANIDVKTSVRKTVRTTVTLTPQQAADIIQLHLSAPGSAVVEFDCGYCEFLREVTVTWEQVEESGD